MVRLQIELVAQHHHERLADVRLDHEERRAETGVDVRVLDVVDPYAERRAVAEEGADLIAEVADDDVDLADPEGVAQELDVPREQRLAADLEHDLRHGARSRMDPPPLAGGGDHADAGRAHEDGSIRSRVRACNSCRAVRLC